MHSSLLRMLPLLVWAVSHAGTPLLVCLPGGPSPMRIDSALGPSLSPRKVIAFVRVRDLEDILPSYPQAPIVTTSAYAAYLAGYSVALKGGGGKAQSKYLVMSADSTVNAANLSGKRVGILDFLGREKIARFVEDAFGMKPAVLKRVSKREDLLSLIGMEAVDAVIVEEGEIAELKKETRLRLELVMESKPIGRFTVLAVPAAGDGGVKGILLKQPKPVMELLGVERWE